MRGYAYWASNIRRGEFFLLCWGDFSLTEDIPFSHGGYYFLSQNSQI